MPTRDGNDTPNGVVCRYAVFYLVCGVLQSLWPVTIGVVGTGRGQFLAVAAYVTGLMTQANVTCSWMATAVGVVTHDGLTRLVHDLGWTLRGGAAAAARVVEGLGIEGWLILDDVLIVKVFGKAMALCGWDWDHTQKRHVFGQRVVFVVWSCGWLLIPLAFAFWRQDPEAFERRRQTRRAGRKKKGKGRQRGRPKGSKTAKRGRRRKRLPGGIHYRTKNELARILVRQVVRRGVRAKKVLFDNWYASQANLRFFEGLGLDWVTSLKSNTQVMFNGEILMVKQVAASVIKPNYHYYRALGGRARSFEVVRNGRPGKLTVIKDDTGPEGGRTKYLMTNDLTLTVCEHIRWYRRRWMIEVFFRDVKQELGLGRCEARSERAVIAHVILVCVAYTIWQLLKPTDAQDRPSVRASRHALTPLVTVFTTESVQIARLKPSGQTVPVPVADLWQPVRTRLSAWSLPETLDLSKVYLPPPKAA